MKKILFLFVCLVLIVSTAQFNFASPLIFKATKEIKTNEIIEFGSFDASKYKQIRIGLKAVGRAPSISKEIALLQLNLAKRLVESYKSSIYSQINRNEAKAQLDEAQTNYDNAIDSQTVGIFGIENESEILIFDFEQLLKQSVVIDSPPNKISVKGFGKGTYFLYVWASQ